MANVANLQLVRTEIRGQELAIRAALGAGRGRIARGLLAESLLVGLMGGVAGLAVASLGLPLLLAVAGDNLPAALAITIDPTVLAFAPAISLLAGLAFGAIPVVKYAGVPAVVATALEALVILVVVATSGERWGWRANRPPAPPAPEGA